MTLPDGVQLTADVDAEPELAGLVEEVLTTDAVAFLADLHRRFNGRRLVELSDGEKVTHELVNRVIDEELAKIRETVGEDAFSQGRWDDATSPYREMALSEDFSDFLTLPAYERMP